MGERFDWECNGQTWGSGPSSYCTDSHYFFGDAPTAAIVGTKLGPLVIVNLNIANKATSFPVKVHLRRKRSHPTPGHGRPACDPLGMQAKSKTNGATRRDASKRSCSCSLPLRSFHQKTGRRHRRRAHSIIMPRPPDSLLPGNGVLPAEAFRSWNNHVASSPAEQARAP
jgi:hypothetical protein